MTHEDWRTSSLGEICTFISGGTPSKENKNYWGGEFPWVTAKDLKQLIIRDAEIKLTEEGISSGIRVAPQGSVLILIRGMTLMKDLPIGYVDRNVAFNQDIKALVPGNDLSGLFLAYALISQKKQILYLVEKAGHGTGRLDTDLLKEFILDYPSNSNEQEKILDILTTLDRAINLTSQLIVAKQLRKRGLMQQLLTGRRRFAESRGWSWRKIGDLFRSVTRFELWDDEKTYIQAIVRRWSQGIEVRPPLLGKQIKTKNLQVIHTGDFLISDIQASYGAMSLVRDKQDGLYVSNVYTILVPRDDDQIYTPYFDQFSRTPLMSHLVVQSSNGFKAERIRLSFILDTFLQQKVYLPDDVSEQKRIADVLQLCDDEIVLLNRKLALLKKQKQGLMQQLLTGKVRVKV